MFIQKFSVYKWLIVLLMLLSSIDTVIAQSQPTFLRACPRRIESWPLPYSNTLTCPPAIRGTGEACPAGYRYKAHQDCCGALPLCSLVNTVYSVRDPRGNTQSYQASICGQGCTPGEMPTPGSGTCFGIRERQTSWYKFEVQPLRGGGRNIGDYAGYLRMKIYPCDVSPNNPGCDGTGSEICNCDTINPYNPIFCADQGCTGMGNTDYDWILFDITNMPVQRSACNRISAPGAMSQLPGQANLFSCNWSGTFGPTGMADVGQGDNVTAAGCRFNRIRRVTVGQRFILAVDGYTITNLKGYKIDFTGACQNDNPLLPTANVSPDPVASKLIGVDADTNYCASGTFNMRFDNFYYVDSLINRESQTPKSNKFVVVNLANPTDTTTYKVLDILPNNNGGGSDTSTNYLVSFGGPVQVGRYRMIFTDTLRQFCGNVYIKDTVFFRIKPFILRDQSPNVLNCAADLNPDNRPRLGAIPDTSFKFDKREFNSVARTKWKLIYYATRGNRRNDSIYPGFNLGSMTINSLQSLDSSGSSDWRKARHIEVRDTITEEATRNPNIVVHGFRMIVTMPYNSDIPGSLATGCVDSVDFEVAFKPVPFVVVSNGDTTCNEGPNAKLSATSSIQRGRTFTWYKYGDEFAQDAPDSVGTTLSYDVPFADGNQYYRLLVVDTTFGISCSSIYPPYGRSAITVTNAKYIISSFETKYATGGENAYPVTVTYTPTAKIVLKRSSTLYDTIPVSNADSLIAEWDTKWNNEIFTTKDVTGSISRVFDGPNIEKTDSLVIYPTLTVYDKLAKGLNIAACVNQATQKVVVTGIFVPNVILPNDGNPDNDFFQIPKNEGFFNLLVYNRWGNLVYKVDTYNNDWGGDGHPAGVYYYVAKDNRSTDSKAYRKGWIQIIK